MNRNRPCEVIGHGGADGFFPANTEPSFRKAVELGVDRIECDVTGDRSDRLFLAHDEVVTDNEVRQNVRNLAFDRLRQIDPQLIPLDDLIEIAHGQCALLLDLKTRGLENATIHAIETIRSRGDDVSISSTHARSLRKIGRSVPNLRVGLSRGHWLTRVPSRRLQKFAGWVEGLLQIGPLLVLAKWSHATELMLNFNLCISPVVRTMHRAGLRVYAWTPERVEDFETLLDRGVDGIITHRPDRLIDTLKTLEIPRL